jgi:DNA-directed RNA polymerase beta subunit
VAGTAYCRLCRSSENVEPIVLPYCMKLLVQELQAMNIFVEMFSN